MAAKVIRRMPQTLGYSHLRTWTIALDPAGWLPYVSPKPLLMIIGDDDRCTFTEVQRDVYNSAGEPKKLVS
jgi:fermentation-respiration switch protein FrsA (DUF1100 family)